LHCKGKITLTAIIFIDQLERFHGRYGVHLSVFLLMFWVGMSMVLLLCKIIGLSGSASSLGYLGLCINASWKWSITGGLPVH
jgi:hypothetical protein